MNPPKMSFKPTLILFPLMISLLQFGCLANRHLEGEPGFDVSSIRAGNNKGQVEKLLGAAIREWNSSEGFKYRVYNYDAGAPPNAGEAAAVVFFDVMSLGVSELVAALNKNAFAPRRIKDQMAVAYNSNDVVIGVFAPFGDFDELPPDGRSRK